MIEIGFGIKVARHLPSVGFEASRLDSLGASLREVSGRASAAGDPAYMYGHGRGRIQVRFRIIGWTGRTTLRGLFSNMNISGFA